MSTVGELVDRMYRDYLSNPADTPVQVRAQAAITDTQTNVVYADGELAPEEQASIGPGTVIELSLEMMRVWAHDESTRTLTVTRGLYGTTATSHAANELLIIAPKWPRYTVFQAIADEIVSLYPDLYAVGVDLADSHETVHEIQDTSAVDLLYARQMIAGHYVPIEAEMVSGVDDDFTSGVVVQYYSHPGATTPDVYINYAARFPQPTSESETLSELGVSPEWARIILLGALSSLIVHTDVDVATQEFISESLEAQGYPVTSGLRLAGTMLGLRQAHLDAASRRLKARFGHRVSYRREL